MKLESRISFIPENNKWKLRRIQKQKEKRKEIYGFTDQVWLYQFPLDSLTASSIAYRHRELWKDNLIFSQNFYKTGKYNTFQHLLTHRCWRRNNRKLHWRGWRWNRLYHRKWPRSRSCYRQTGQSSRWFGGNFRICRARMNQGSWNSMYHIGCGNTRIWIRIGYVRYRRRRRGARITKSCL